MAPSRDHDDEPMTIGEHLEELRRRILYALLGLAAGTAVAMLFGQHLVALLEAPYVTVMREAGVEPELAILQVTDGFTTYVRLGVVFGLVLSSPWVFYQLWTFVSAGLYPRERRYVLLAVPFSAALFAAGAAFFLFGVSTMVLRFFVAFSAWLGLTPLITFQNHLRFMTSMMVAFGLGFQTPLAVMLLAKVGLVRIATLHRYRRHVIVGILILAALFTSPSPVDQVALAIPMWALYELGVLLAWLTTRNGRRAEIEEAEV